MNTPFAERGLPPGLPTLMRSFAAAASTDIPGGIFLTPEMNRSGSFAVGVLSGSGVTTELDSTMQWPINASGQSLAKYNGSPVGLSFLGQ